MGQGTIFSQFHPIQVVAAGASGFSIQVPSVNSGYVVINNNSSLDMVISDSYGIQYIVNHYSPCIIPIAQSSNNWLAYPLNTFNENSSIPGWGTIPGLNVVPPYLPNPINQQLITLLYYNTYPAYVSLPSMPITPPAKRNMFIGQYSGNTYIAWPGAYQTIIFADTLDRFYYYNPTATTGLAQYVAAGSPALASTISQFGPADTGQFYQETFVTGGGGLLTSFGASGYNSTSHASQLLQWNIGATSTLKVNVPLFPPNNAQTTYEIFIFCPNDTVTTNPFLCINNDNSGSSIHLDHNAGAYKLFWPGNAGGTALALAWGILRILVKGTSINYVFVNETASGLTFANVPTTFSNGVMSQTVPMQSVALWFGGSSNQVYGEVGLANPVPYYLIPLQVAIQP